MGGARLLLLVPRPLLSAVTLERVCGGDTDPNNNVQRSSAIPR